LLLLIDGSLIDEIFPFLILLLSPKYMRELIAKKENKEKKSG